MKKMLLLGAIMLVALMAVAQAASIVLLFDATGSMDSMLANSSQRKIDAAKAAAIDLLNSASSSDEIALIVFRDCNDIKVESDFTSDFNSIKTKVQDIEPTSDTPIAGALTFTGDYIKTKGRSNAAIILLSDGEETCGGNPASAATAVRNSGITVVIHTIGYDVAPGSTAEQQLQQVAQNGGGNYYPAQDAQGVKSAFQQAYQSSRGGFCCFGFILPLALLGFVFLRK